MKELNKVFVDLRKENLLARQNFMCCQTCGCAKIEDEKTDKHIGYVFYHQQDKEDLDKNGCCYLAYGSLKKDIMSKEIARRIIKILAINDIPVIWDFNSSTRIKIVLKRGIKC